VERNPASIRAATPALTRALSTGRARKFQIAIETQMLVRCGTLWEVVMRSLASVVFVSALFSPDSVAQTATFEQLRTPFYPFAALTNEARMSGDGRVVTDGMWRWSRNSGYTPAGFIPGEAPGSTLRRRPRGLSDDGVVEFGELRRDELFWPNDPLQGYYWQGGGPFTRLAANFGVVAPWPAMASPMSGDGSWVISVKSATGIAWRRDRSGHELQLGLIGGSWAGPVSRSGQAFVVHGQAAAIPPTGSAGDAQWIDLGPAASVVGVNATGDLFFGHDRFTTGRQAVIWRAGGEVVAKLGPTDGGRTAFMRFLSDDGSAASGISYFPPPPFSSTPEKTTPFVWRSGELPRRLDLVLRRFGAAQAAYFNLTDLLGMSSDGRTILGYATSPWFGSGAFVATIPEWLPCASDFDFDGVVGDEDFVLFAAAYNDLDTTACDLNTDDRTDDLDFVLFAAAYDQLVCP
jgi:hypothetical protein